MRGGNGMGWKDDEGRRARECKRESGGGTWEKGVLEWEVK